MLETFASAPFAVQVHVTSALCAAVLAPVQLFRRPGGEVHRWLGYMWVVAMASTSLCSFWINEIRLLGPFSPIHLLSAWVLFTLVAAIRAARARNIKAHRAWLQSCAFWGLGVAGLFTLLPGRRMSEALFQNAAWEGFAAATCLLFVVTITLRMRQAGFGYAASARTR